MLTRRLRKVLIANRGEIAVRILRSAQRRGMQGVGVITPAEAQGLLASAADELALLETDGVAGYLDIPGQIALAIHHGCDCIHPGYGFLAENGAFAKACTDNQLAWIGPSTDHLEILGDKARARSLAQQLRIPVLPGTTACSLTQAQVFMQQHGPCMIKAVAGGGGRGMRKAMSCQDIEQAWRRCESEAVAAFGDGALYVEQLLTQCRHIEVQTLGDGHGTVVLGDRDCSVQRRQQKVVELAPAPFLPAVLRHALHDAASTIAQHLRYQGLCTFEFLVEFETDTASLADPTADNNLPSAPRWYFLEANPRIQVEHTITEVVTGLDLVDLQFQIAEGQSLSDLGFGSRSATGKHQSPPPRGWAAQWRICAEHIKPDLAPRPAVGALTQCAWPTGPGLRIDTHVRAGHEQTAAFDSLIAKLIVHAQHRQNAAADQFGRTYPGNTSAPVQRDSSQDTTERHAPIQVQQGDWSDERAELAALLHISRQALRETTLCGVSTNLVLLQSIAESPAFGMTPISTAWLESDAALLSRLIAALQRTDQKLALPADSAPGSNNPNVSKAQAIGRSERPSPSEPALQDLAQEGAHVIRAPMAAKVVSVANDLHGAMNEAVVLSAMKMEHVLDLPPGTKKIQALVAANVQVEEGQPLMLCWGDAEIDRTPDAISSAQLDEIRPDLQRLLDRQAFLLDAARPQAMSKRHAQGGRSARQNVTDLCDDGSLIEYGALTYAAQRRRRSVDDLIANTPADGLITGIGTVNAAIAGNARSRCAVLAYDFTVLAGTQGWRNHQKTDRILHIAHDQRLPVVLFAEGGGGRPGDVDMPIVAGLHTPSFRLFAALRGKVPVVSIVHGRCFAGNAALAGCADFIIATRRSNLGMGGPAMIEGGGLGVYSPDQIGPAEALAKVGVIGLVVDDEASAVAAAKRYLAYFQIRQLSVLASPTHDTRPLRHLIPENRVRAYEIRAVIEALADRESVLELRPDFGVGIVTALIRIEGYALGLIANNPRHLGGAIDAAAADKAAGFMALCNAHRLPMLSLCDTPGFMVGPEAELQAQVRHSCAMFTAAAALTVPRMTVVMRKGYGLGAQAMAFGSFEAPLFTISWPTGEFGGMGLEGAVKLGYRKELEAITDPAAREARYQQLVAGYYEAGGALNMAAHLEIDAVIDPADTRSWVVRGLQSAQGSEV